MVVDLPVSQKICQIFETTSYRLYIGSCQTCNSGCFPVQGLRGSKKYRPPCGFCLPSVKGCMNGMLISILGFLSHPEMEKMKLNKKKRKKSKQTGDSKWLFFNFLCGGHFTFEADISTYQKKNTKNCQEHREHQHHF